MRLASRLEILSSFLDVWGAHLVDEESLRIKWLRASQIDVEVVRWICSSAEAEARLSSCYSCASSAGIGPQLIAEEKRV